MPDAEHDAAATLHVIYGDALAELVGQADPAAQVLVVREALRDGPLVPSPNEGIEAFATVRAHHLAAHHGAADEAAVRAELVAAWTRLLEHTGPVVLHVDETPCIDCATFASCALEVLHRAGRGVVNATTGVSIARGGDLAGAVELAAPDVAAGAGAWRMLVAGDAPGLTLTATDLEGRGGMAGFPELPGLLVTRAKGDVALEDVHP